MAEIISVLDKIKTGELILIVVVCFGLIGAMFKMIVYFAKSAATKLLEEIRADIKSLVGKVDLIEINTKAMDSALREVLNGDYKSRFSSEKEKLIEDAKFIRDNP